MSATLRLRDYQREAIDELFRSWTGGMRSPAVVLPTGAGKGHPQDTEIVTPDGLRLWGHLRVGDQVYGSAGTPVTVTGVFDRGMLPCYRVSFSDGSSVVTDPDHLWAVRDHKHRRTSMEHRVLSTEDLLREGLRNGRSWRWKIPVSPTRGADRGLLISPYTLGSLLANGHMSNRSGVTLTTPDPEVTDRIRSEHIVTERPVDTGKYCPRYGLTGLNGVLRGLGLMVNSSDKFIPRAYLASGYDQRVSLLQGLMDGDGSSRGGGRRSVLYHTTSQRLADDVAELVCSLGGTASLVHKDRIHPGNGAVYRETVVQILLPPEVEPFHSSRKRRDERPRRQLRPRRSVVSVERVSDQPIRCISVDAEDQLYQVTRHRIVTHNTVIFAALIEQFRRKQLGPLDTLKADPSAGNRVMVLVHRDELADQAIAKIRAAAPDLSVGKVKAQDNDVHADVMVCSVQTLAVTARRTVLKARESTYGRVGLIITDECFPAGTMVGGSPIESLRVGDLVPAWNEETGAEELRPVRALMSKAPSSLVRVTLEDGSDFACTPNHPILTEQGWCPAGELWRGASVVSFTHDADAGLRGVRNSVRGIPETEDRQLASVREGVLQGSVPGYLGEPERSRANGTNQSEACFCTDAGTQSDEAFRGPRQGVCQSQSDGSQATVSGREWSSGARSSADLGGVPRVADRVHDHPARRGPSVSLQGGHGPSHDEGVRGGGRGIPLLAGTPELRPAPGRKASFSRVAGVQVLEPGRDGTYGGVCPDGLVYNIDVDTAHTYLINDGVVVHNCHHAAAVSYQKVYEIFPDALHAGFTATLERGDGVGLGSVWEDVVYSRSPLWMMKHGHLVQPRAYREDIGGFDLKGVKRTGGDYQAGDLGRALEESDLAETLPGIWKEHAAGRSTVVFTPTVATAHGVAESFRGAGIPSAVVSGETPREERLTIFEDFRNGRVTALVNCMVLTEGFDAPWASCAIIARPTQSRPLYIQMVGRVLRPWRDKTDAVIINVAGAGGKLSTLVDLAPGEISEALDGEGLLEAEEREQEEAAAEQRAPRPKAGPTRLKEVESLFAASHSAWLSTAAGVMFISAGEWTYFLWPNREQPGSWDVLRHQKHGKWYRTAHTALDVEMAMSWAEAEAEDHGSFNVSRTASWRKGNPSPAQMDYAAGLGIAADGMDKAELSDMISYVVESRALDPYVGVV